MSTTVARKMFDFNKAVNLVLLDRFSEAEPLLPLYR